MSEIQDLKNSIAETSAALGQKVHALEVNLKEAAVSVKDSVEQGTANFRNVMKTVSPTHQLRQHPVAFSGALFGLGLYLAKRSNQKKRFEALVTTRAYNRFINEEALSKAQNLIEPVAFGLFTAVAGEVVKKYFPIIEPGASSIQSALLSEMTQRVARSL